VPKDPTRERVAYLPPRAGKARKLILRSQLGLPWMLAAILFGLVILVAGVLFLVKGGRPGAPWQRVAPVTRFADGAVTQAPLRAGEVVVVDRRGGTLRAFLAPSGSCPVTGAPGGFARPCTGQAWDQAGAPVGSQGTSSPPPLRAMPATVAKGDLYVNRRAAELHPALQSSDGPRERRKASRAA
jgi:nitrite reductase/ring-hydroxylating ferredoxin subunit